MTKEQESISRKNWKIARLHFGLKGYEYVLHHKNPDWKENDVERYIQWNFDDLEVLTRAEHIKRHPETCNKSVESRKGKHLTEEHKAKIARYGSENCNSKKVKCLETGQIFESALAASKWLGAKTNCVAHAIMRGCKSHGYTFIHLEEK